MPKTHEPAVVRLVPKPSHHVYVNYIFMPPPALEGVGHIAFRRGVTSVCAYVRMLRS